LKELKYLLLGLLVFRILDEAVDAKREKLHGRCLRCARRSAVVVVVVVVVLFATAGNMMSQTLRHVLLFLVHIIPDCVAVVRAFRRSGCGGVCWHRTSSTRSRCCLPVASAAYGAPGRLGVVDAAATVVFAVVVPLRAIHRGAHCCFWFVFGFSLCAASRDGFACLRLCSSSTFLSRTPIRRTTSVPIVGNVSCYRHVTPESESQTRWSKTILPS
jgi:hypothetical protein